MKTWAIRFLRDEGGATAIEYGLICGLIFLAIVGAITTLANNNTAMYNRIADAISAVIP